MMMPVKVIFDSALDFGAWPGPLGSVGVAYGESWVGPMGLLDILETRLGLGGRFAEPLQRACRLAVELQSREGYWRQSFEVDPLGTSRRLLSDRDQLWLAGWTGEPISARLTALAEATSGAAPGLPDRLAAIAEALAVRSPGIEQVLSYTEIGKLTPLWRRIFAALRKSGVAVQEPHLDPAEAQGDLHAARQTPFTPTGDGRLCLLRRHGAVDLADEIASALAASDSLDGVVIVGADPVLDRALSRHGLPIVGATQPPYSSELLRLVIAAAFHPMRMPDLHALLAADPGPVPKGLAVRLLDGIQQYPGRRTSAWREAMARGLEQVSEDKREDIERRVTTLLDPATDHDQSLSVSELRTRLGVLDAWARARAAHVRSLGVLSKRIHTLLDAVELMGARGLSRHDLRRLCDDLGEPAWGSRPAQAGLAHVPDPGAVLAPARAIVWWNFSRDAVVHPHRLLLTQAEKDGLQAAGIEPPNASLAMAITANAWRRPFTQVEEALVLACPLTDSGGQANHPHPLWDDVIAGLHDHGTVRRLERDALSGPLVATRNQVVLRPLPTSCRTVKVRSPLALRASESPSSIEKLLGCSLAWALSYPADLRSKITEIPPAVAPLVFGKLAHRILEQVLGRGLESPDDAANLAGQFFTEQATDLCEELGLPQHQADRATVKRAVVESARDLVRMMVRHGVSAAATEVQEEVTVEGQVVAGRLDLVWSEPPVVLDLKWGKTSPSNLLKTGTAVQLAAYSAMCAAKGPRPESGYYVLNSQQLLAEPGGWLAAEAQLQGSQTAAATWAAAVATLRRRRADLAEGRLEAPGSEGDEVVASFAADGLTVVPPCRYCGFSGLCGRGGVR